MIYLFLKINKIYISHSISLIILYSFFYLLFLACKANIIIIPIFTRIYVMVTTNRGKTDNFSFVNIILIISITIVNPIKK